jgi:transketolase
MNDFGERLRAWLVTGPIGRGLAFALDFAVALRTMLSQRR